MVYLTIIQFIACINVLEQCLVTEYSNFVRPPCSPYFAFAIVRIHIDIEEIIDLVWNTHRVPQRTKLERKCWQYLWGWEKVFISISNIHIPILLIFIFLPSIFIFTPLQNAHLFNLQYSPSTSNIYRGYYTAARRYDFYLRVVKTILFLTRVISSIKVISSSHRVMFCLLYSPKQKLWNFTLSEDMENISLWRYVCRNTSEDMENISLCIFQYPLSTIYIYNKRWYKTEGLDYKLWTFFISSGLTHLCTASVCMLLQISNYLGQIWDNTDHATTVINLLSASGRFLRYHRRRVNKEESETGKNLHFCKVHKQNKQHAWWHLTEITYSTNSYPGCARWTDGKVQIFLNFINYLNKYTLNHTQN
jgi:hypothetical protein